MCKEIRGRDVLIDTLFGYMLRGQCLDEYNELIIDTV